MKREQRCKLAKIFMNEMIIREVTENKKEYLSLLFTDHYDHPVYECGVQLVDMVYLRREMR